MMKDCQEGPISDWGITGTCLGNRHL
jgi:hypothetical protein